MKHSLIVIEFVVLLSLSAYSTVQKKSVAPTAGSAERYLVGDRTTSQILSLNVADNVQTGSARSGTHPDYIVVSPNGRLAFIANQNANYISVVDLTINSEISRIRNVRGSNLALNLAGTRLVVPIIASLISDEVVIIDTTTLQILQRVSLNGLVGDDPGNQGDISLAAIVVTGNKAYIDSGTGLSTIVVDINTFAVSTVAGSSSFPPFSSPSLAATPSGGHVVALRQSPSLAALIIDTTTNTIVHTTPFTSSPTCIAVTRDAADPDGVFGYVMSSGNRVSAINLDPLSPNFGVIASSAVLLPAGFVTTVNDIALTADSNRAYMVSSVAAPTNNVAIVDTGLLISNPGTALVSQFRLATNLRAVRVAVTESSPSASAPVVSNVSPTTAVNSSPTTIQISGSNFIAGARVRFGNLEPVASNFLSSNLLEAVVPQAAASQVADVIVTNPNSTGPVSQQHESGILSGQLTIANPPGFQPINRVATSNFGEGSASILNLGTTLTQASPTGPEPMGLAFTADDLRLYVESFSTASVKALNLSTGLVEATITIPNTTPGQSDGIAIAPNPATGKPVALVVNGFKLGNNTDERLYAIDADGTSPSLNTIVDTLGAGITNGLGNRGALAVTPNGRYVYSNAFFSLGQILVFDRVGRTVTQLSVASLGVSFFQPHIHVSPDGQSLLLVADGGPIKVFDIGSNPLSPTLVTTITGATPPGLDPVFFQRFQVEGSRLFAYDPAQHVVEVFNFNRSSADFSLLGTFTIPGLRDLLGAGFGVLPGGSFAYAAFWDDGAIAVVDTAKVIAGDPGALITRIATGLSPISLAVSPRLIPVNGPADSGPGSLREALLASNMNVGQTNTIQFNIAGDVTINLTSPLPTITNPVIINGLTNGGRVTLDGSAAGAGANGLTITGGGSTVSGLNINNFSGAGISLVGAGANNIQDVRIGTTAGSSPTGNTGDGIVINSSNNVIGGATPATANIITSNGGHGLSILGGAGNQIRINSISANGGLGIDLGNDGVTTNDAGDADTGANNLQNYPVLSSATSDGAGTTIEGTLNSTSSAAITIDFYFSTAADPSGFGEGQTWLGSTTVNTNGSGDATFNVNFATPVTLGNVITAIARNNAIGDTSEFSQAKTVTAPTAITLASFSATSYDNGVMLEWQTGFEVNNLGFRIYRDVNGKRTLVNERLIAGSALRAGFNAVLQSGEAYVWWDNSSTKDAVYWLEDVDLRGHVVWHGPFYPNIVSGSPSTLGKAALLGKPALLSKPGSQPQGSNNAVETVALLSHVSSQPDGAQNNLASRPAVKISVKHEGWYRVTQSELLAAGLPAATDPRLLRLFADGREQPILVSTGKEGRFNESSSIEFYGIGLDTPSTDARIYWLIADKQAGLRVAQVSGVGAPSAAAAFTQTVERKDRSIYFSSLRNGEKENFFGAIIAGEPVDHMLDLQHVVGSSTELATVEVALQGVTMVPHRVLIQLNDRSVFEASFNEQEEGVAQFNVSHSLLREGSNSVRLIAQNGPIDVSLVDHIRISYQHAFAADNDVIKLRTIGRQQVTIGGFTSKAIRVFDVTNADAAQELLGEVLPQKDGCAVQITPPGIGPRALLAITADKIKSADSVEANHPSRLLSAANAADLIIIANRNFFSAVEPFRSLRQTEGYKVALVDIANIYDEFSYGNKSPMSIKAFLSFARSHWKSAPRYVLLVGDASYDARNYLEAGVGDLVPSRLIDTRYMETASDDWFADFDDDGMPELAVGRLPARTAEEASQMIAKIVNYQKSSPSTEALLAADANDGFNFEAASDQLRSLLPESLSVNQVYRGRLDPFTAKERLLGAINRGQKVVNYIGHGSTNLWRDGFLTSADAAEMTNAQHLSLFVTMTCLNGFFHDVARDSLSESLLKAENGGAVAVWASSGMTVPSEQALINQQLYRLIFSGGIKGQRLTIGDSTLRAKSATHDMDVRRTWVLLGDPTTVLR